MADCELKADKHVAQTWRSRAQELMAKMPNSTPETWIITAFAAEQQRCLDIVTRIGNSGDYHTLAIACTILDALQDGR